MQTVYILVMVLHNQTINLQVAAYDTMADCLEVADSFYMESNLTPNNLYCVAEGEY